MAEQEQDEQSALTLAMKDSKLEQIESRYQHLFSLLDPKSLSHGPDEWPHCEEKPNPHGDAEDVLFLGFYSEDGLRRIFAHYGFIEQLKQMIPGELSISIRRHPKGYDIFQIHSDASPYPLVDLVARIDPLSDASHRLIGAQQSRFLRVKWLRMRNPFLQVNPDRPLFPGQDFPGLGLGREMLVLLKLMCVRVGLDGVVDVPERLHNAALYFRRFRFINPVKQGVVTAILRDTRQERLTDLAWGVELGLLSDTADQRAFRWVGEEQILPRTQPFVDYFSSAPYLQAAQEAMAAHRFRLRLHEVGIQISPTKPSAPEPQDDSSFLSRLK